MSLPPKDRAQEHLEEREAQQFASTRRWNATPNKLGMRGEKALAIFFGGEPDLRDKKGGDGGIDLEVLLELHQTQQQWTEADVKTRSNPDNLLVDSEKHIPPNRIYVLAGSVDGTPLDCLSWAWGWEVVTWPTTYWQGNDALVHFKPRELLRPMADLIGMYCWQWRHHGLEARPADWSRVGIKPSSWMVLNPPPDLHEFLRSHRNYGQIPAEAWAKFEAEVKNWQERRRLDLRHAGFFPK